jgi:hypothetical protein
MGGSVRVGGPSFLARERVWPNENGLLAYLGPSWPRFGLLWPGLAQKLLSLKHRPHTVNMCKFSQNGKIKSPKTTIAGFRPITAS